MRSLSRTGTACHGHLYTATCASSPLPTQKLWRHSQPKTCANPKNLIDDLLACGVKPRPRPTFSKVALKAGPRLRLYLSPSVATYLAHAYARYTGSTHREATLDACGPDMQVWVQSKESVTFRPIQPLPLTALANRTARTPPPPQATDPWFVAARQVLNPLCNCT